MSLAEWEINLAIDVVERVLEHYLPEDRAAIIERLIHAVDPAAPLPPTPVVPPPTTPEPPAPPPTTD